VFPEIHSRAIRGLMALVVCTFACSPALMGQGTLADYQRASDLQSKARDLVVNSPGSMNWIGESEHFWYTRTVKGGTDFILVDAASRSKKPAFDQDRLAVAISKVTSHPYTGLTLPFAPPRDGGRGSAARAVPGAAPMTAPLTFLKDETVIQFGTGGFLYQCTLTDYVCTKDTPIPAPDLGRAARESGPEADAPFAEDISPEGIGGDPVDGLAYQPPPQQGAGDNGGSGRGRGDHAQRPCAAEARDGQENRPQPQRSGRMGVGSQFPGQLPPEAPEVCASFDGKWEAFIQNFNVFVKPAGAKEPGTPLSTDGSEDNRYTLRSVAWSPNSQELVAYHTRPGYDRLVTYIESSPRDQIQPKSMTIHYPKPGDTLDIAYPVLFEVASKKEIEIDHTLFPNAFSLSTPVWWKDGRGFTFEYNQRGHQAYTVVEVAAQTGVARALISEKTKTFFYYSNLGPGLSAGRKYRHDVNDGKEIIWASERDGWEHLYLYDGVTGTVKNQITKGDWLVRNVDYVDDEKRQIWFEAGGSIPGQDPYFVQY
jgi:hypothetical protein